ncbi:hypothetical protein C5167_016831 [Papaver somniferum]|uniref:Peptidyl-prolyl cis-trans isomerase n=1 Tax=Papaver somniferum TaxID=3469 RepID=A0A4Y7IHN8_PAPSO|nr:hypothetical protein C5167_016831 [Papaver somniferum]
MNDRFLKIALYQGYTSTKVRKISAAAANVDESKDPSTDPTLLCCAFKKHRIYLFREECPKTVDNFITLCRNGYYNNVIFHEVVRGVVIKTGSPRGPLTNGVSIWGGNFEDKFHESLRDDLPFTVSMDNEGEPNTNGSRFLITDAVAHPERDNKHTVFGRVVKGMDVVQVYYLSSRTCKQTSN